MAARMLGNARNNRKNSPEGLNETEEGIKTRHLPVNFSFPFFLSLTFIQVLEDFVSQASFAVPRKKLKLKSVYNFTYVWRIHIKYAITKKSSQIVYNSGRYTLDLCHASLFISKMQKYAHIR